MTKNGKITNVYHAKIQDLNLKMDPGIQIFKWEKFPFMKEFWGVSWKPHPRNNNVLAINEWEFLLFLLLLAEINVMRQPDWLLGGGLTEKDRIAEIVLQGVRQVVAVREVEVWR